MEQHQVDEGETHAADADRDDYEPPILTEHPGWGSLTGSIGSGIT